MKCSLTTDRFIVYDDVLPEEQFKELMRYVSDQSFTSVHEEGWQKVWALADGTPLKARHTAYSNPISQSTSGEKSANGESSFSLYPTGDSIDDLMATIIGLQAQVAPLVGKQKSDWQRFSAIAYVYPPGAGLSWHNDSGIYTGAFTFYLSENWQSNWGGELMVHCGESKFLKDRITSLAELPEYVSDEIPHSRVLVGDGIGFYIEPRPNRLVILRGGTPHKINHVVTTAGARPRATIAGFFAKPALQPAPQSEEIVLKTSMQKRDAPYVARLHDGKSSLVARGHTYAIGTPELYEIFRFIAQTKTPFTAADLPGDLPDEEKLDLIRSLAGIGMFIQPPASRADQGSN